MPSVLIADDAAFMRMMIKNILTDAGYEILGEAENGAVAVAKHRELKPDITTMDITMPELDGLSALRQIREADPTARVVMCSAMYSAAFSSSAPPISPTITTRSVWGIFAAFICRLDGLQGSAP